MNSEQPLPPEHARADDLYSAVLAHAGELYTRRPTLLSTTRHGALDGAWRLTDATGAYDPVPETPMSGPALQAERAALARLLLAYCDHPDADPALITRSPRFPRCAELYVG